MKYKNLHLIKFFFVIMLLVIFLAVLILGFCWFFYFLPIDFPGTVGDWIAGLSALAGGALTLGGVWWTINNTENQRKEDIILQYDPIINLKLYEDSKATNNLFYEMVIQHAKKMFNNYLTMDFQITNANYNPCTLKNIYFSEIKLIKGVPFDLTQKDSIPQTMMGINYPLALENPYNIRFKIYYPDGLQLPSINKYSLKIGITYCNNFKKNIEKNYIFCIVFSIVTTISFDNKNKFEIKDIEISIDN